MLAKRGLCPKSSNCALSMDVWSPLWYSYIAPSISWSEYHNKHTNVYMWCSSHCHSFPPTASLWVFFNAWPPLRLSIISFFPVLGSITASDDQVSVGSFSKAPSRFHFSGWSGQRGVLLLGPITLPLQSGHWDNQSVCRHYIVPADLDWGVGAATSPVRANWFPWIICPPH